MTQMTLEDLKKTQIEILDYVSSFCIGNNIKYWIDCGTLLGAIRHKGYIPWDDDIDIGMLREDYNKFIAIFNTNDSGGRYHVRCIENDASFNMAFAKVLDNKTVLYEPDETGFKLAVNIDVFVYDNAPDDDKKVKKQFDKRDLYKKLYLIKTTKHLPEKMSVVKCFKILLHWILQVVPNRYYLEKLVANSKKYAAYETKRVGNFTSDTRQICRKEVFEGFTSVEFEGKF